MNALNQTERDRIAANIEAVKTLMPELLPEIKTLHAAGLIDGWRNVTYIGPHRPSPLGAVSGEHLITTTMEQLKERMKNGNPG